MKQQENIEKLYNLRKEKEQLQARIKDINSEMEGIETQVLRFMEEEGMDKIATTLATVSRTVKMHASVEDITALVNWAHENGRPDIVQKRISQKVFDEVFLETGEMPEGTKTYNKETLGFRKKK